MVVNKIANFWQEALKDADFRFELKAQETALELAKVFSHSGMTQKELAEKLGWQPSRVSKILHGASNITLKTLFQVCEALDTDFDIQVGGKSQLKHELEIVRLKKEQMDEMLKIIWQTKRKAPLQNIQQLSTTYEYAS